MNILTRFQNGWNAFIGRDPTKTYNEDNGPSYYNRPDRIRMSRRNERTIIAAVYNKIATDVASVSIKHVRLDENERYKETVKSGLNECLTLSANLDQTGRAFIKDLVMSMFDEGVIAAVPIDTTMNPMSGSWDIRSIRVGKITQWYKDKVKVEAWDERVGKKREIIVPKAMTAIIENPFYEVMNDTNSTFQRLVKNLNLLDILDEQNASGKLDMIIQLPYVIKSEARRVEAEKRRKDIEMQLTGSKYGVAYIDGTERITQLNRAIENNLLTQVEYLTNLLYSQLGITVEILNGTADEKTMLNYQNRIVEPILSAIVDEFKRKFLTKTARTQGQSISFFMNYFKMVPVSQIADIADKLARNAILTSNEIRQIMGFKPSDNPDADELRNKANDKSSPEQAGNPEEMMPPDGQEEQEGEIQNGS